MFAIPSDALITKGEAFDETFFEENSFKFTTLNWTFDLYLKIVFTFDIRGCENRGKKRNCR